MWSLWLFFSKLVPFTIQCLVDSKDHLFQRTLSLEPCRELQASLQFLRRVTGMCSFSCTAWPLPSALPTFPRIFVLLTFFVFRINKINSSHPASILELWLSFRPFLSFSFLSGFAVSVVHTSGHTWSRLVVVSSFCQSPPRPHILWEVPLLNQVFFWILSMNLTNFLSRRHSNHRQYVFFLHDVQKSVWTLLRQKTSVE